MICWSRVKAVYFKELLDVLRDRMTLLMMIGLPIATFPAIQLIMAQSIMIQAHERKEITARICVQGPEKERIKGWLSAMDKKKFVDFRAKARDIIKDRVDVIINTTSSPATCEKDPGSLRVELRYDKTTFRSKAAARLIVKQLSMVNKKRLAARLRAAGLSDDFLHPVRVKKINIASRARRTGDFLGRIVPLVLILMLTIGAFYPTIDIVAGEKERGTFETLLSTPVTKLEILLGKYFTAFTISMTAGLANLVSMTASTLFTMSYMSKLSDRFPVPNLDLSFWLIAVTLSAMIPLALFITALLMSIAAFAHNVWQAQNYLTPLLMLIIVPCVTASWPSARLHGIGHFIPVYNISLLFRGLMKDTVSSSSAIVVVLAAFFWAGAAFMLANWIFQSEEVVLSDSPEFILPGRRENNGAGFSSLSPAGAFALFGFQFILLFYIAPPLQKWNTHGGLVITEWLLILAPVLLVLRLSKVRTASALLMNKPDIKHVALTLVMTPAALVAVSQASVLQNRILPFPRELIEGLNKILLSDGSALGFLFAFFAVALSPAICEEILFRGALLTALKERGLHRGGIIVVIGVMFGAFHLSIHRFLSVAALGVYLTYIALKSDSIFTSMLTHCVYNGTIFIIGGNYLPDWIITPEGVERFSTQGFPPVVVAAALIVLAFGVYIFETLELPSNCSPKRHSDAR